MRWVADTGPLLHLAEAKATHLLPLLGRGTIPPAVADELAGRENTLPPSSMPAVVALTAAAAQRAADWHHSGLLHRGEAEAIALARQAGADVFLTDDAAARAHAASLGLHVRGSLGVVPWLAGQRRTSRIEAAFSVQALAESSLWIPSRILAEARTALDRVTPP
jgi:predicted nucleic acid-binding protein